MVSCLFIIQKLSYSYAINYDEGLIKEIKEISFDKLKGLSLYSNQIESIEPLAQLRAACIQWIFVGDNKLSTLQSLRKMKSRNIYGINFSRFGIN